MIRQSYYIGENEAVLRRLYAVCDGDEYLRNRGMVKRIYRILLQNAVTDSMNQNTVNAFEDLVRSIKTDDFVKFKGTGFKTRLAFIRMKSILAKIDKEGYTN